jgi:hypothetical protein
MKNVHARSLSKARALRSILVAGALGLLGLTAAPSGANAITWNLSSIPLSDGGSLSGFFSFNESGYLDAWNLTSSGGTLASLQYSNPPNDINASQDGPPNVTFVAFYANPPANYFGALVLKFAADLLTASGTDAILAGNGGPSFECQGFLSETNACTSQNIRYIGDGAFATSPEVPLPPSAPLFAGGLLLLGLLWWRKNRSNSPFAI